MKIVGGEVESTARRRILVSWLPCEQWTLFDSQASGGERIVEVRDDVLVAQLQVTKHDVGVQENVFLVLGVHQVLFLPIQLYLRQFLVCLAQVIRRDERLCCQPSCSLLVDEVLGWLEPDGDSDVKGRGAVDDGHDGRERMRRVVKVGVMRRHVVDDGLLGGDHSDGAEEEDDSNAKCDHRVITTSVRWRTARVNSASAEPFEGGERT